MKEEAPPGDVIYDKDDYIIHQIDGEEHKVKYCIPRPAVVLY